MQLIGKLYCNYYLVAKKSEWYYNVVTKGGQTKMSRIDKIIKKLKGNSGNLTFEELTSLLKYLGYAVDNKGRTSGSRVRFYKQGADAIIMHKPHPRKTLLSYQTKQILQKLKEDDQL